MSLSIVVQKFGGTSVANLERLNIVAVRVKERLEKGDKVVVVVSAMAGETDRLLKLAQESSRNPGLREQDMLVSTGEQVTASLLAMILQGFGIPALSMTGPQVPILTNDDHANARIENIPPQKILNELEAGKVVVVTGFQGINRHGDITTLGRGGSDLSAVALAVALRAKACQIFTDVPGVFTSDPNVCQDARLIAKISHEEMLELASLGAKVLQTRSVQLARRYLLPVWVGSTFQPGEGTWVIPEEPTMEDTVVAALTCDRNESQIIIEKIGGTEKFYAELFKKLAQAKVNVDVIVFSNTHQEQTGLMFTVARGQLAAALEIANTMKKLSETIEVRSVEQIAKVSAVGLGMKTHSGIASKMFNALVENNIPILGVSTSEIKISCLIPDRYSELSVRILHDVFELGKEPH